MQRSRNVMAPVLVLLCGLATLSIATPVGAINLLPQQLYALSVNPSYPEPESDYTVSITGPAFDISRGAIVWSIDGVRRTEFDGARSITLRAGELGDTQRVRAQFTADGAPATLDRIVTAQKVDVVVEGETLVPHFYAGRPLPSAGSSVRLVAVPHLYTPAGTRLLPQDLLYRWSINNKIVSEGRGADTLSTTMPQTGDMFVTLTIESVTGSASHQTSFTLEPAAPVVRFYEESPLYGLARNAIAGRLTHPDAEVTVRAEPFFVSRDILANAQYAWTLNGESVTHAANNPQSLTLSRVGEGGEAEVGFSIRNLRSLLQYAAGVITVHFTSQ